MTTSTGYSGAAAAEVRPATTLESHLQGLAELNKLLYDAVDRSSRMADRLIGREPSRLQEAGNKSVPTPSDPPISRKLEDASGELRNLMEGLHEQLSRLERL